MQLNVTLNQQTLEEVTESKMRLKKAAQTKAAKAFQPTWDQVWTTGYTKPTGTVQKGIFQMKLSEPDKKRLLEVKEAVLSGEIDSGVTDLKKFNKSHALRLYKELVEQRKESIIAEMIANIPENYHSVQTVEMLEWLIELLRNTDINALDTETTGLHLEKDKVVGMSITVPNVDQHFYIPFLHENANVGKQLDKEYVMQKLQQELGDRKDLVTVMFNAKFDLHQLVKDGLSFKGDVYDALVAMKLLNENEPSYQLKKLVNKWGRFFGYTDNSLTFEELFSTDPRDFYINADYRLCYYYACKDTHLTWLLWKFIEEQLEKHEGLKNSFYGLEVPTTKVAFTMEQNGMPIDLKYASDYKKKLETEIAELDRKIKEFFGDINWDSPKQVAERLYDELGMQPLNEKRSTDAHTLKTLAKTVPELQMVLDYREKTKLLGSFISPIPQLVWSDQRIHGSFNQDGTKTGRFASDKPNLQNIPYPARPMFKAPDGKIIVSADFSQIEPRVLAHMSGDPDLQKPYLTGGDLYVDSAVKVYGQRYSMEREQFLEADDVTWRQRGLPKHPRKMFKQGLLATMYETSGFGLSTMLDISPEDGEQFIEDFHSNFPAAYQYAKDSIAYVDEYGYCLTMGGRKRRFGEYTFTDKKTKETVKVPRHTVLAKTYHELKQRAERIVGHPIKNVWAERDLPYKLRSELGFVTKFYNKNVRQIVNARTQGTAAEIMKVAMIRLHKLIAEKSSEWKLIATIHDEVLLEVPDDLTVEEFAEIEDCMVNAVKLDIPLKTDIAVMRRWSEDVTLAEYLDKGLSCFDAEGWKI